MSYDLNRWAILAREAETDYEREEYYNRQESAQKRFIQEHNSFREKYRLPNYSCRINTTYLRDVLPVLLSGQIYVPHSLRSFIFREYSEFLEEEYPDISMASWRQVYLDNGWNNSVLTTGVNVVYSKYEQLGSNKLELLMFEVWEFTLTYPEYSELFVEEWN